MFFHQEVLTALDIDLVTGVRITALLLTLVSIMGIKHLAARKLPFTLCHPALNICLLVALIVATATHYGYRNNTTGPKLEATPHSLSADHIPNWGWNSDLDAHIKERALAIYEHGFPPPPPEKFAHRGIQLVLLNYGLIAGSYDLDRIVHLYKVLSFLFYFCTAYITFVIGHYIFALNKSLASLVAVSALIFSPLKYPLFPLSPTYRGFFSASGTFYHNITQLSQFSVAICGTLLVLMALKFEKKTFSWGCLLISASFFLKPSLFTVIAPAIILLIPLYSRPFEKDKLTGYFSLFAVPLLWRAYGALFPVDTPPLKLELSFFEGYRMTLQGRFPDPILGNNFLLFSCVLLFSFAAFIPAAGYALSRLHISSYLSVSEITQKLRSNTPCILLLLAFSMAMVSTIVLAGSGYQINFKWSAAATYVLLLPVLVLAITRVDNRSWRCLSWFLYALHLCVGAGYLFYYADTNSLF